MAKDSRLDLDGGITSAGLPKRAGTLRRATAPKKQRFNRLIVTVA